MGGIPSSLVDVVPLCFVYRAPGGVGQERQEKKKEEERIERKIGPWTYTMLAQNERLPSERSSRKGVREEEEKKKGIFEEKTLPFSPLSLQHARTNTGGQQQTLACAHTFSP